MTVDKTSKIEFFRMTGIPSASGQVERGLESAYDGNPVSWVKLDRAKLAPYFCLFCEDCSLDCGSVYWEILNFPAYAHLLLSFLELTMTIDKSLKVRRGGSSNRSVLTRGERLEKLKESDRWQEGDSPFGLAKVRVRKLVMKKKKKKAKEEEGEDK